MIALPVAPMLLAALVAGPASAPAEAAERPNFVMVLADDLGYGDLGCYGAADVRTPHLDRFAGEALRLTSCYAGHANCSPSRAALMTGRTPTRTGVRNWIAEGSPVHLRRSEVTVATLLRRAGYDTCHVGKWHLNGKFDSPEQPQPNDHGFRHWFGTQNNALPNHRDPANFVRNGEPVGKLEGYSADLVAAEAVRWLREGRDGAKPFFLYVCFHEPHEPIATDPKHAALYPSDDPSYSAHHGNVTQMDAAFGRLTAALDDAELRDRTLVVFTSDNGPAVTRQHPHGSAGPLRDKKGSLYEGGVRVPGLVRWPGRTTPGSVSDEPVSGVDVLPTLCAAAGIDPPRDRPLDGVDVAPVFSGGAGARPTPLYWHFNRASGGHKVAVRVGDWKLLATLDRDPVPARSNDISEADERAFKAAEPAAFALYDLGRDVGETTDLAATEPAKLAELKALLVAKYREVRDESPTWPAWTFTGAEGRKIEWPDYVGPRPR